MQSLVGLGFHPPPGWSKTLSFFSVGPIANLKGHYFQPSLFVCLSVCLSLSLSVNLYACVSLTGTSTLQR